MSRNVLLSLGAFALLGWLGTTTVNAQLAGNGEIEGTQWNVLILHNSCNGGTIGDIRTDTCFGCGPDVILPAPYQFQVDTTGDTNPDTTITVESWRDKSPQNASDNPKGGMKHDGVDFPLIDFVVDQNLDGNPDDDGDGMVSPADGWNFPNMSPDPVWVSDAYLKSLGVADGMENLGMAIDLNTLVGRMNSVAGDIASNDNVMAIATTYVENLTGANLPIVVCMGTDDSGQVWVNEQVVISTSACRGSAFCKDAAEAVLVPGINRITTLVWEGGGGFNFRVALRDQYFEPLTGENGMIAYLGTGEGDDTITSDAAGVAVAPGLAPTGRISREGWNMMFVKNLEGQSNPGNNGLIDQARKMLLSTTGDNDFFAASGGQTTFDPKAGEKHDGTQLAAIDYNVAAQALVYHVRPNWEDAASANTSAVWFSLPYARSLATPNFNNGNLLVDILENNNFRLGRIDFRQLARWIGRQNNSQADPPIANNDDNTVAICTSYVENTTGSDIEVLLGGDSDDSILLMCNNVVSVVHSQGRGINTELLRNFGPALLKPGINRITMMVWNGGGGWDGQCGIVRNGKLVTSWDQDIVYLGADTTLKGTEQNVDDFNAYVASLPTSGGFIKSGEWLTLFPLYQQGSANPGVREMNDNWLAPFDIGMESPQSGDQWPELRGNSLLNYSAAGLTHAQNPGPDIPTWFTLGDLNALFGGLVVLDEQNLQLDFNGYIDQINPLTPLIGTASLSNDDVMSVTVTYVNNTSGGPLTVNIQHQTDDAAQVWVNDQVVQNRTGCCSLVTASDVVLPPGVSKIAVIVWEGGGGWNQRLTLKLPSTFAEGGLPIISDTPLLTFDGPVGSTNTGQAVLTRTVDNGDCCPQAVTTVTMQGNANVDDAEAISITDSFSAGNLDALTATVTQGNGTVDEQGFSEFYRNTSSTGGDIHTACDDFTFDYSAQTGEIDFGIQILSYQHATGAGRWGKSGPMIRWENDPATYPDGALGRAALFHHLAHTGPDTQDGVKSHRRWQHSGGDGCDSTTDNNDNRQIANPDYAAGYYARITRRRNATNDGWVTQLWQSADSAVVADPSNDANWLAGHQETWLDADAARTMPDEVLVGFANSEHNSDGAVAQTYLYKVLTPATAPTTLGHLIGTDAGGVSASEYVAGLERTSYSVTFDTDGAAAKGGLSYTLESSVPQQVNVATNGPRMNMDRKSSGPIYVGPVTPVGPFENTVDIGPVSCPGSTVDNGDGSYAITACGGDIWNTQEFHFAYEAVTGDFEAVARVTGPADGPRAFAKHGIMSRYTCEQESKYDMTIRILPSLESGIDTTDPPDGVADVPEAHSPRHQSKFRHIFGGTGQQQERIIGIPPGGADMSQSPEWLKLSRKGNYVWSEFAEDMDGEPGPWVYAGGTTDPGRPETLLVGLAVTAHSGDPADVITVTFDNYSIGDLPETPSECSAVAVVLDDDFNTVADPPVPPAGAQVLVNAECDPTGDPDPPAFSPVVVDYRGNGRLQIQKEGYNNCATATYFDVDGEGLGSSGFIAKFDAFVENSQYPGGGNKGDGFTFAVFEGDIASAAGVLGGSGSDLGYRRGGNNDIPVNKRRSAALEIDLWDSGSGHDDAHYGNNRVGNWDHNYHVALDFNATTTSSQTNWENLGRGDLPNLFPVPDPADNSLRTRHDGAQFELHYDARTDVYTVYATGLGLSGYRRTKVMEAEGPDLSGDVFVGFTSGNGGATADIYIDNLTVTSLCCETANAVEITSEVDEAETGGDPVAVTANVSGADGNVTYSWSIESGSGAILSETNQATAIVQCTGEGPLVVKVVTTDDFCGGTAEATKTITCTAPPGGKQLVFDVNQDGICDISDSVSLLGFLYTGELLQLPCGTDDSLNPLAGDVTMLDWQPDGFVDLSDAVAELNWEFSAAITGQAPHHLDTNGDGTTCLIVEGCPDAPVDTTCNPAP